MRSRSSDSTRTGRVPMTSGETASTAHPTMRTPARSRSILPFLLAAMLLPLAADAAAPAQRPTRSRAVTSIASPVAPQPWRPALAVLPFTDRTEGAWLLWTGRDVGEGLAQWVADSLGRMDRWRLPDTARVSGAFATRHRQDRLSDANAMALGSSLGSELALTGVVTSFAVTETQPDPNYTRWGVGSGRRRTTATVVLELRLLDCASGSVVRTSVLKREQTSQSSSSVGQSERVERSGFVETPLGRAAHEVVAAAVQLLEDERTSRASVRVARVESGAVWLDAGRARGLAAGQRLVVMRPELVTMDPEEGVVTPQTESVAAELVVTGFAEGIGHPARCRLQRGRVEPGDVVRLLSDSPARSSVGAVAR